MTANQLVAYNLRRARDLRGLTQEQAAERLEPYLGKRWTKAVFSAAETSVTSDRVREFSADDILAMSAAFDLPIAWFFLPPHEKDRRESVETGGPAQVTPAAVIDAALPAGKQDELEERLTELSKSLPARERPGLEQRAADIVATRLSAAFLAVFGDVASEGAHLRRVADLLESAPSRALEGAVDDLQPIRRLARAAGRRKEKDG